MKYRNGFVSNSSTTSFLLYGTAFEVSDIIKYFDFIELKGNLIWSLNKTLGRSYLSERGREGVREELALVENAMEWDDIADYIDDLGAAEMMEMVLSDSDVQVYTTPYDETIFVGVSPTSMKDDHTFGEWKKEVAEKLYNAGMKNDLSLGWVEEAWRDG